jgi:hypothetical protein
MATNSFMKLYNFTGKPILITGGGGVLCGEMARVLFECGGNIAILDYSLPAAERIANSLDVTGIVVPVDGGFSANSGV